MARVLADLVSDAGLHQATPVEDGDPVGDVPDHREVVADEEVAQMQLLLQVPQQVEDLCLNGEIQGADGLVADDQAGRQHEGAGDRDALQLPAGELCGIARRGAGVEPHALERAGDLGSSLCPVQRLVGE
jgi:hypothetical protein